MVRNVPSAADDPRDTGAVGRSPRRLLAPAAWLLVLAGTLLPTVLAREVFGADPAWLFPAQLTVVGAVLLASVAAERFRPLGTLAAALTVAQFQFRVSPSLVERLPNVSVPAGAGTLLTHELLQFALTAALLAALFARGYSREDLFLRSSDLSATVSSPRLPGLVRGRSWRLVGAAVGLPVVLTTAGFLAASGAGFEFGGRAPADLARLAGVVVALSAVNAFSEEVVFRAVPLADLSRAVGRRHAAVLLGAFFGLSHYYGTPGGVPGVLMSAFLGWFLAESLLGTRGLTAAWALHFLLDVVIFSAVLY
jgi:hypothetical protein